MQRNDVRCSDASAAKVIHKDTCSSTKTNNNYRDVSWTKLGTCAVFARSEYRMPAQAAERMHVRSGTTHIKGRSSNSPLFRRIPSRSARPSRRRQTHVCYRRSETRQTRVAETQIVSDIVRYEELVDNVQPGRASTDPALRSENRLWRRRGERPALSSGSRFQNASD